MRQQTAMQWFREFSGSVKLHLRKQTNLAERTIIFVSPSDCQRVLSLRQMSGMCTVINLSTGKPVTVFRTSSGLWVAKS